MNYSKSVHRRLLFIKFAWDGIHNLDHSWDQSALPFTFYQVRKERKKKFKAVCDGGAANLANLKCWVWKGTSLLLVCSINNGLGVLKCIFYDLVLDIRYIFLVKFQLAALSFLPLGRLLMMSYLQRKVSLHLSLLLLRGKSGFHQLCTLPMFSIGFFFRELSYVSYYKT